MPTTTVNGLTFNTRLLVPSCAYTDSGKSQKHLIVADQYRKHDSDTRRYCPNHLPVEILPLDGDASSLMDLIDRYRLCSSLEHFVKNLTPKNGPFVNAGLPDKLQEKGRPGDARLADGLVSVYSDEIDSLQRTDKETVWTAIAHWVESRTQHETIVPNAAAAPGHNWQHSVGWYLEDNVSLQDYREGQCAAYSCRDLSRSFWESRTSVVGVKSEGRFFHPMCGIDTDAVEL